MCAMVDEHMRQYEASHDGQYSHAIPAHSSHTDSGFDDDHMGEEFDFISSSVDTDIVCSLEAELDDACAFTTFFFFFLSFLLSCVVVVSLCFEYSFSTFSRSKK